VEEQFREEEGRQVERRKRIATTINQPKGIEGLKSEQKRETGNATKNILKGRKTLTKIGMLF
jgi:hypothetical protein